MFELMFDSFLFPLIVFMAGILIAGRYLHMQIDVGTSFLLALVLVMGLPYVIYSMGEDLITLLAIILFAVLTSRSLIQKATALSSITLFLVAILVGGFLLQILTGYRIGY